MTDGAWTTRGWSRDPNGRWIEVGHVAGIGEDPPPTPPEISVHQVADKLNELEVRCEALDAGALPRRQRIVELETEARNWQTAAEANRDAVMGYQDRALSEEALMWLQRRTVERIKRGVEGTTQP